MIALILAFAPRAIAYKCVQTGDPQCPCRAWPDNEVEMRIYLPDFSAQEVALIMEAMAAWSAGTGQLLRGADFNFTLGGAAAGPGTVGDGVSIISRRPGSHSTGWAMDTHNQPDPTSACHYDECDIHVNEDVSFSYELPSKTDSTQKSFVMAMTHELGHCLGLKHWTDDIAIMNGFTPTGGDVSNKLRVNEDDATGQRDLYPGSSTGKNLMLSKFAMNSSADVIENWEVGDPAWEVCAGCDWRINPPKEPNALLTGTSTLADVEVQFSITGNEVCMDGVSDYVLGTTTLASISPDVPDLVALPSPLTVPAGTPVGTYYLCAWIDPDDDFAETSESDNNLKSEQPIEVIP